LKPIETVVPCGEQGMHPYEICTLGSINLAHPDFWKDGTLNEIEFVDSVRVGVDILDDAFENIDFEYLDEENITQVSNYTKRLGLGIMGWADVLKDLNIGYNDLDKVKGLVNYIGQLLKETAHQRSREIALRDGYNFDDRDGRKHLSMTCIAPTGGITLLTKNKGFSIEPYFEEANSFGWRDHLKMQSLWQLWIDNAISKTINLDQNSNIEEVYKCYLEAYRLGCKSITVYRDQSHSQQPIKVGGGCQKCIL